MEKIKELKKELKEIQKQKYNSVYAQDFEKAAAFRDKEKYLIEKINKIEEEE